MFRGSRLIHKKKKKKINTFKIFRYTVHYNQGNDTIIMVPLTLYIVTQYYAMMSQKISGDPLLLIHSW